MSDLPCIRVGAVDMKRILVAFGPEVSVCIVGRHAVGKSEVTYQAAKLLRSDFYSDPKNTAKYGWSYERGLPVIERRLSQLTEGDLTGMPDLGSARDRTSFKPCDWLIDACERPVVLFLDERNRALEGVKQAVFQIMDSRAFYGYKLHPDTRVIVAENVGDLYNVQQRDPAEISRAAMFELSPTVDEWLTYAATEADVHDLTVGFIRSNPNFLEFNPDAPENAKKVFEPNKKYPDRRAWVKLDKQLQRTGLINNPNDTLFYSLVASMVGIEAALRFTSYAKNYKSEISVTEILDNWPVASRKLRDKESTPQYLELAKKLEAHIKKNNLTQPQAKNVAAFMKDAPVEPRMVVYASLSTNPHPNLFLVHPFIDKLMLETAQGTVKAAPKKP